MKGLYEILVCDYYDRSLGNVISQGHFVKALYSFEIKCKINYYCFQPGGQ